jgi:hypothetical protein
MSADRAKANGTASPTYPKYRAGGWKIMPGWRNRGFIPCPSGTTVADWTNGLDRKRVTATKKAVIKLRKTVAQGIRARARSARWLG